MISSESVRAMGQTRLTKPTFGLFVAGEETSLITAHSPRAGLVPARMWTFDASAAGRSALDAERTEHLLGLLGHLLLHLVEDVLGLLDVVAHHHLHERVLHVH